MADATQLGHPDADNPQAFIDNIAYYPFGAIKTYRLPAVSGAPTLIRYQRGKAHTVGCNRR